MRARVIVEGDAEVRAALANITPLMKKLLRPKLIAWAEKVLAQAKPNVPVGQEDPAPGLLRESGRVIRPTISATKHKLVVSVVFGGDAILPNVRVGKRTSPNVYAFVQHDDLTIKHDEGGPKFLERPFIAAAPEVPDLVLDAADEAAHGA